MRRLLAMFSFALLGTTWASCGGSEFSGGGDGGSASSGVGGQGPGSGGSGVSVGSGGNGQATGSGGLAGAAVTGAGGQAGGSGGSGGTVSGGAAGVGHGGIAGSANGGAGRAGSGATGGSPDDGGTSSDAVASDAPSVIGTCTIGGGECPAGYACGCGGPGPVGLCECHKKCQSAADCSAPNSMCGCSPDDTAKICVSMCFCFCG
jgi:hypothetical protein